MEPGLGKQDQGIKLHSLITPLYSDSDKLLV